MYQSDAYWCSECDRTHIDECEKSVRTPKAGETWVWMTCRRHRFNQLRDVVWIGRSHEDQPEWVQEMELEHIRCGCRYPADDPERAILALRQDERRHEAEFRMQVELIAARAYYPEPTEVSPWWAVAVILAGIGIILYFFLCH